MYPKNYDLGSDVPTKEDVRRMEEAFRALEREGERQRKVDRNWRAMDLRYQNEFDEMLDEARKARALLYPAPITLPPVDARPSDRPPDQPPDRFLDL